MKLYLISQDKNNDYDTYSDAVVAAKTEERARMIHPGGHKNWDGQADEYSSWCSAEFVKVEYIGTAKMGTKEGVVCSSFHAG